MKQFNHIKASFGLRNIPHEYGIVILMFGRNLFIGIHIPLRRRISISLKNKRNNYSSL